MADSLDVLEDLILNRLQINDFKFVEIESKKRVSSKIAKDLRKHLMKKKKVEHVKTSVFFDQFLDTPNLDLLKRGASMRIRYKRNGTNVYIQYKGPGFLEDNLLYRSEFSSRKLKHVVLEESHHDIIRFTKTSIQKIFDRYIDKNMARAMRTHLGSKIMDNISISPLVGVYQKDKFAVDLGAAFLEPSLDRVHVFNVSQPGLAPLSMFWEYENEIKAPDLSAREKLDHISDLTEFDEKITKEFGLKMEPLDKYHRSASILLPAAVRTQIKRLTF